jgi:hypothetical protein
MSLTGSSGEQQNFVVVRQATRDTTIRPVDPYCERHGRLARCALREHTCDAAVYPHDHVERALAIAVLRRVWGRRNRPRVRAPSVREAEPQEA